MKFGTFYAYWLDEWNADDVAFCSRVSKLGFDILEVAAGSLAEKSDSQLLDIRKAAIDNGLTLTGNFGLNPEYNVASSDESIRRGGVEFVKKVLRCLEKIGATHTGGIMYAYWPYDFSTPIDKPAAVRNCIRSMKEIGDYAADCGVMVAMEVVNRFEQIVMNTAEEAVAIAKEIDKPSVKVMLDTFHMNIEEPSMGGAIRTCGDMLGYLHLGDSNRDVPGKGHLDWDEIAKALKDIHYDGPVVMEPFVRMGGSVGNDIKIWRNLASDRSNEGMDKTIAEALQFVRAKFLD